MIKEREILETLMTLAEAYVIALLREALLAPLTPIGKRDQATISARFVLLNTLEQLDQENNKPKQPSDVLG